MYTDSNDSLEMERGAGYGKEKGRRNQEEEQARRRRKEARERAAIEENDLKLHIRQVIYHGDELTAKIMSMVKEGKVQNRVVVNDIWAKVLEALKRVRQQLWTER